MISFKPCLALVTSTLVLFIVNGCVSQPTINTHPDKQVDFSKYHSFALIRPSRAPNDPNVTPELIRSINDETRQAFKGRGLNEAQEDVADLSILVHGGIQDKVDIVDWGYHYGRFHRWGWGMRDDYELQQYKEGTLIIDAFDAKTKDLVWRGTAVADVDDAPNVEKVKAAIDTIVSRYPQ